MGVRSRARKNSNMDFRNGSFRPWTTNTERASLPGSVNSASCRGLNLNIGEAPDSFGVAGRFTRSRNVVMGKLRNFETTQFPVRDPPRDERVQKFSRLRRRRKRFPLWHAPRAVRLLGDVRSMWRGQAESSTWQ